MYDEACPGRFRIEGSVRRAGATRHKKKNYGTLPYDTRCSSGLLVYNMEHHAALGHALSAFGATSTNLRQVAFPEVPTIMISRGKPQKGFPWGDAASEAAWRKGHETLIENLSNKRHWIADDSAHAIVIDQPEIVLKAIAATIGNDR